MTVTMVSLHDHNKLTIGNNTSHRGDAYAGCMSRDNDADSDIVDVTAD